MPKVSIDPTNWEGVTEEDRAALDSAGHLELQNEYEMKYLGAKIRADADTLQEVKRRCAQAQRVHWDLRQVSNTRFWLPTLRARRRQQRSPRTRMGLSSPKSTPWVLGGA